jgi:hypothetical protein
MRVVAAILAAGALLSAPVAFGQTDPAATPPAANPPASGPAPAAPSTSAPATPDATQQQHTDADHQVTCHTVQTVESRLRRSRQRICGTRQQWEQMQDQNQRDIQQMGQVQGRSG